MTTDNQKSPAKRKTYSAPALEKGLDILEVLAATPGALSLSEIAYELDRSVSEIFRMLVVLEQRGYIKVDRNSDKYRLTMKMFELSHRNSPVKRLISISRPFMQRLSTETKQSCHMSIYYNGRGLVIAQQDSPAERILSVRLGAEAFSYGYLFRPSLIEFCH